MNKEELNKIIAYNIKYYRENSFVNGKKHSISSLSKIIGISEIELHNIEKNYHELSIDLLYKISCALKIPISKFMEKNNE